MSDAKALTPLADAPAPANAVEAIGRIRVWHETLKTLAAVAEAQIMESAWVIRRQYPDKAAFEQLIERELDGILPPARAWLMAETWAVSRRQRDVRQLVSDKPHQAMRFVREFVDAGRMEQLELLDENDQMVAELLSATPRKRRARIRELIAAERAAAEGRSPADIARIEELEAAAAAPADMDNHPVARVGAQIEELHRIEGELFAVSEALTNGLAGHISPRQQDQLYAITDRIVGVTESLVAETMGDADG